MSSTAATAPTSAEKTKGAVSNETALQNVADAMRDAASTASEHATNVYEVVGDAGPRALRAIADGTYTTAYVASYGVVYATVFVAQSLLLIENPFTRGLWEGGAAARKALKRA